ncbi:MAG: hypothetical protein ABH817_02590 [archaeon]
MITDNNQRTEGHTMQEILGMNHITWGYLLGENPSEELEQIRLGAGANPEDSPSLADLKLLLDYRPKKEEANPGIKEKTTNVYRQLIMCGKDASRPGRFLSPPDIAYLLSQVENCSDRAELIRNSGLPPYVRFALYESLPGNKDLFWIEAIEDLIGNPEVMAERMVPWIKRIQRPEERDRYQHRLEGQIEVEKRRILQ